MNDLITQPDDKLLTALENIKKSIAEITDIQELQKGQAMASGFEEAWKKYYKSSGFGFEQMFLGWETKVRSEKRMGEILPTKIKNGGTPESHDVILNDLGISAKQSSRYQQLAEILDEKFDKMIEEMRLNFIEPTTSALFKSAHVSYNSGEDEWYTPPEIIEAARKTMGSIDLDPASSEEANKIVRADTYYTFKDNGLKKNWFENVWMNPPYSQPLIEQFSEKMVLHYSCDEVKQACVLVNNATETYWFQIMLQVCTAVCFPKNRVKFVDKNGIAMGAPLQGQAILYFGKNKDNFYHNFKEFGVILWNNEAK